MTKHTYMSFLYRELPTPTSITPTSLIYYVDQVYNLKLDTLHTFSLTLLSVVSTVLVHILRPCRTFHRKPVSIDSLIFYKNTFDVPKRLMISHPPLSPF